MEITTIGIDLAKSVFEVCGADSGGRVVMRPQLRRGQVEFPTLSGWQRAWTAAGVLEAERNFR